MSAALHEGYVITLLNLVKIGYLHLLPSGVKLLVYIFLDYYKQNIAVLKDFIETAIYRIAEIYFYAIMIKLC